MTDTIPAADFILFVVLPYVALPLFVAGTIERLVRDPYSISSGSSQFLENRLHFWSLVPFHYGIIVVFLGHLLALVLPQAIAGWNTSALRLFVLEATGLAFGMLAVVGFAAVILRRIALPAVRVTTRSFDWIVYAVLLLQLGSGVGVAVTYLWGSAWATATLTPYIWSLLALQPDLTVVSALPVAIKVHVAGAFVLAAVFPFSRLMHIINVPNPYLWRRPQVVRWYRPHAH